jgi:hypothetical protein
VKANYAEKIHFHKNVPHGKFKTLDSVRFEKTNIILARSCPIYSWLAAAVTVLTNKVLVTAGANSSSNRSEKTISLALSLYKTVWTNIIHVIIRGLYRPIITTIAYSSLISS